MGPSWAALHGDTSWFWVPRVGKAVPGLPVPTLNPRHSRTIHREHTARWGGKVLGGDTGAEWPQKGQPPSQGQRGGAWGPSKAGAKAGSPQATQQSSRPDRRRPRREGPLSSALGGGHPYPLHLRSAFPKRVSGLCPLEQGAVTQLPPGASEPLFAEKFSLRLGP